MRITASAPGKLVVLGEYAVLEGAPGLVLAVDRRARAALAPIAGGAWQIASPTLGLEGTLCLDGEGVRWIHPPPPALGWVAHLLEPLSPCARTLPPCRVELDTRAFFLERGGARVKLGLGSSAALAVALLGALHALGHTPPPVLTESVGVHRALQAGRGSGIDVAAALLGGLARFQLSAGRVPQATPLRLPAGLRWCCVFTGRSTSTATMLAQVDRWHRRAPKTFERQLQGLADSAARAVDAATGDDAGEFLASVRDYAAHLARFGAAAGVDINSREHRAIGALATDCGCTYKSCGAGGGDVGVTFAVEDGSLREFARRVAGAGFRVIELEADPQGLEVVSTV